VIPAVIPSSCRNREWRYRRWDKSGIRIDTTPAEDPGGITIDDPLRLEHFPGAAQIRENQQRQRYSGNPIYFHASLSGSSAG